MKVHKYIEQALITLGLSEGEAVIYAELLESSPLSIADLKTKTNYSMAGLYKIVNLLIDKGFIQAIEGQYPTVFVPVALTKVAAKFMIQSRRMDRIASKLKELENLSLMPNSEAEIFEGNALIDYYLNIPYKIDDLLWCFGSFEAVMKFFGENVEKDFIKNRVHRGIHADAIIFDDSQKSKDLAGRDALEKRETKLIYCKNYPYQFSYLFGDTHLEFYKDADQKIKIIKTVSPEYARAKVMQYQIFKNSTPQ